MGSTSRHLHHSRPWTSFHPEPPGHLFFSYPGQVHMRIFTLIKYMRISSILFRYCSLWVFWFSCVQVLDHYTLAQPLQVYTQNWHVVFPAISHLHFQSHPLIFSFRIPIPGSAVPTPPFASLVLLPGSILTHMICPIHRTF
jgi:hypothetical protein